MTSSQSAVDKSWEFLPKIAEKIARLPQDVQESILNYGRVMKESKMVYIHVVDEGSGVRQSPAKIAASALEGAGNSINESSRGS